MDWLFDWIQRNLNDLAKWAAGIVKQWFPMDFLDPSVFDPVRDIFSVLWSYFSEMNAVIPIDRILIIAGGFFVFKMGLRLTRLILGLIPTEHG